MTPEIVVTVSEISVTVMVSGPLPDPANPSRMLPYSSVRLGVTQVPGMLAPPVEVTESDGGDFREAVAALIMPARRELLAQYEALCDEIRERGGDSLELD